ncbi:MAG: T9SS type A sorting domain-containing protein [Fidelibacterota bacterium]|jgi:hypothetical protein
MINNTTAAVSYESIQSIMDSLSFDWLVGNWDVIAVNDGDTLTSENGPYYVMFNSVTLSVEDDPVPDAIALHPAFPNSFNPSTTIRFDIPNESRSLSGVEMNRDASLQIFDISGRVVEALIQGNVELGQHEIRWNATTHPSGVYFAVLNSSKTHISQKLVLMK